MGNQVGDRQTHWEKYTRPSATPGERIIADQPLSIDIYLPPHFVTLHRKVNIMNQLSLPQSREKQALAGAKLDSWRLMSLDDAPTCDACFWNYEIDTPPVSLKIIQLPPPLIALVSELIRTGNQEA